VLQQIILARSFLLSLTLAGIDTKLKGREGVSGNFVQTGYYPVCTTETKPDRHAKNTEGEKNTIQTAKNDPNFGWKPPHSAPPSAPTLHSF